MIASIGRWSGLGWLSSSWAILFWRSAGYLGSLGVCARVAVCVTGHWLVGHYAHREGGQTWVVSGACVQGYDVKIAGLISMGESWHNNHHVFPGSAKLGIEQGQIDLGWALILAIRQLGLAWAIVTPARLPHRPALVRVAERGRGCPLLARLLAQA